MSVQKQINETLSVLKKILNADLLGVYLYGSSLVGGLQKYSDIDLFVVTNRATTLKEKSSLIHHLLSISGIYMKSAKRPIEMTIVEKRAINPWAYPPRFDFQYGEWLRDSFEMENIEPWSSHEMPDLAVIITHVLLKSDTLFGANPDELLDLVPCSDYMKAILHDLERLSADLEEDTRNVLLTFARTWRTLVTNEISSKPDAADWVIQRLPKMYQSVMHRAKSICMGLEEEHWDDIGALVKSCADFMLDRINEQKSSINFKDPSALIKLA